MDNRISTSTPNGDSFDAQGLRTVLSSIIIPSDDERFRYRNWARSYTSTPSLAFSPSTEEECSQILTLAKLEGQTVRAVGSGHSPSDLPCTNGFMIRMDKLNKIIEARSFFFIFFVLDSEIFLVLLHSAARLRD